MMKCLLRERRLGIERLSPLRPGFWSERDANAGAVLVWIARATVARRTPTASEA